MSATSRRRTVHARFRQLDRGGSHLAESGKAGYSDFSVPWRRKSTRYGCCAGCCGHQRPRNRGRLRVMTDPS